MRKIIICVLALFMAVSTLVATPIQLSAAAKAKYISEIVVAYGDDEVKALEDQGYEHFAKNINDGNTVAVYLCYKTTTTAAEAITDLAMMNMDGNYSFSKYEELLKSQEDSVAEMLSKFKYVILEFVENYNAGTEAARLAYETLNTFYDDDTQQKLGDLFVSGNYTDEQLQTIFHQGNTKLILSVEGALSLGCARTPVKDEDGNYVKDEDGNTVTTTFLDRLGEFNIDEDTFDETLFSFTQDFIEQIKVIQEYFARFEEYWDEGVESALADKEIKRAGQYTMDMFEEYLEYLNEYGLISDEDIAQILMGSTIADKSSEIEYAQSGMTLYDILTYDLDELEGDDDSIFYYYAPLVASFSLGQRCSLPMVSLDGILYQACATDEQLQESVDDAQAELEEEGIEYMSIYAAVDRSIFNPDGIALTTEANTESYANENYDWVDGPDDTAELEGIEKKIETVKAVQKMLQISLVSTLAMMVVICTIYTIYKVVKLGITVGAAIKAYFSTSFITFSCSFKGVMSGLSSLLSSGIFLAALVGALLLACIGCFIAIKCYQSLRDSMKHKEVVSYTYTEIPRIIVDWKDDEEDTEDGGYYAFYYCCKRADGTTNADINGWDNTCNKYWNALYYTKDCRVGGPILASALFNDTGVSPKNYSPVHDFAKGVEGVQAACNLNLSTKSQSQNNSKIYMYVQHKTTTKTASVFSEGGLAAYVLTFVAGAVISGAVVYKLPHGKKREEETA